MYIVIIFCLNTRQNHHKINFLTSSYREVWEILILAPPNISIGCYRSVYLGNFQKMPHKLLKVLANTLAIIKISFISLIGYSNALICVAFLLILAHWQLKQWHFLKFHHYSS